MKNKSKGIGDDIAKFTKATGIDKLAKKVLGDDCGCEERKKKLNQCFQTLRTLDNLRKMRLKYMMRLCQE